MFHHCVIKSYLTHITINYDETWITRIISLSKKFYRYSEYKTIATYMKLYFPNLLSYHEFSEYGKSGIRYRENQTKNILDQMTKKMDMQNITYNDFEKFASTYYDIIPSYIQLEHLIE